MGRRGRQRARIARLTESAGRIEEGADRIEGRVLEAKESRPDGSRVFGVQIIAFGDSKNGRRYPADVMRAAVGKYEGAKAYDHHRTDEELQTSTITGLVGSYHSVEATTDGIVGELRLLPGATHAAEALDASLAAQAKGQPPLAGISHDVMAQYRPLVEAGKRWMEAVEILSVNSADVVADPAAGGRATRMVAGGTGPDQEGTQMTLKELLELLRGATAEKRVDLLQEHKAVLDEFGLSEADIGRFLTDPAAEPVAPAPTVEPVVPVAEPVLVGVTPEPTTESFTRASINGRMLIREAVTGAGLDEADVATVTEALPDRFTEADLTGHVDSYTKMLRQVEKRRLLESGGVAKHEGGVVTQEERDKKAKALDAMFDPLRSTEGYMSVKRAYCDIMGINPFDLSVGDLNQRIFAGFAGADLDENGRVRAKESAQTGTWNLILGDSITRRLQTMYNQPNLQTWRAVVSSIVSIVDFRTQRIEKLGGYGVLPPVNQGAPYQPLATPGNEEATYGITKRGGTEDLTLEAIANDDLRAVQRVPTELGIAAAETLYRFVWDIFNTNPTYTPDSTALFVAGHSNTDTNALSNGNLSAGRVKMRKQSAYGDTSQILSIVPKLLVVNSSLEPLAFELTQSPFALPTAAPDGAATNIPNLHQGMQPIIVDYWSSTTTWFLVADPNMIPTIEIGFYNGQQDPELFVQNDPTVGSVFTSDKLTYKIRHIYGGTVLDFRGLYRGDT